MTLQLSDWDSSNLQIDFAAVLTYSGTENGNIKELYYASDGDVVDEGELGLSSSNVLINRIRYNTVNNMLYLYDDNDPIEFDIGTYFNTGEGYDLTIYIQAENEGEGTGIGDNASFISSNNYSSGSGIVARFDVEDDFASILNNLGEDDKFLIAAHRSTNKIAVGDLYSKYLKTTSFATPLIVQNSPVSSLSTQYDKNINLSVPAIAYTEGALGQVEGKAEPIPTPQEIAQTNIMRRMVDYMPTVYNSSTELEKLFLPIAEEFRRLFSWLETQSTQGEQELVKYLENEIGWGFERFINQFFIVSTNNLLDEFQEIYEIQLQINDYIEVRNRLLFVSRFYSENPYQTFVEEISYVADSYNIIENYSNYTVIIIINVAEVNQELLPVIKSRIEKTIPAHIGGVIIFNITAIDSGLTIDTFDPDPYIHTIDEGEVTNINRPD